MGTITDGSMETTTDCPKRSAGPKDQGWRFGRAFVFHACFVAKIDDVVRAEIGPEGSRFQSTGRAHRCTSGPEMRHIGVLQGRRSQARFRCPPESPVQVDANIF